MLAAALIVLAAVSGTVSIGLLALAPAGTLCPFEPPWPRHPLYFSVLLLIWFCPDLTADRLLANILWSAWIWMATRWEERDLTGDFGDAYREYQKRVPMLIPYGSVNPGR